jgi:hypothetical protein
MDRAKEFLRERGIGDRVLKYAFENGVRTPVWLSELLTDFITVTDAEAFESSSLRDLEDMQ